MIGKEWKSMSLISSKLSAIDRKKLSNIARRIPVFMLVLDNKIKTLDGIVNHPEKIMFLRVFGISVEDFKTIVDSKCFNNNKLDSLISDFYEIERSNINYLGINDFPTIRP